MFENAECYHDAFQVKNKMIKQDKNHNLEFHIMDHQVS